MRMAILALTLSASAFGQCSVAGPQLFGGGPGDYLGTTCASLGDVTGDGFGDFALAGRLLSPAGRQGIVQIFAGAPGSPSGTPVATFTGNAGDELGQIVIGARIDGDAINDIVITAPRDDGDAAGRVEVYRGGSFALLGTIGPVAGSNLGSGAACADILGDSRSEIIVGLTPLNLVEVWSFDLVSSTFLRSTTISAPAMPTPHQFGITIGTADIDGSGRPEVLVASLLPGALGVVHAFSVGAGGATQIGPALVGPTSSYFGSFLVGVGDVDNDGREDFAVAAPTDAGGGSVTVYSCTVTATFVAIGGPVLGIAGTHYLGTDLAAISDIDGDGKRDLAIGCQGLTPQGEEVRLASTASGAVLSVIANPSPGSLTWFGRNVTTGEFTGDCQPEILVGAAQAGGGNGAGYLYTFVNTPNPCAGGLAASSSSVSAASGGTVTFTMSAGPGYASQRHALLLGASGSSPGMPLPASPNLPLNVDSLTFFTLFAPNVPGIYAISNFFYGPGGGPAMLDATGTAVATLALSPGALSTAIGFQITIAGFAGVVPPFFVSNARTITICP